MSGSRRRLVLLNSVLALAAVASGIARERAPQAPSRERGAAPRGVWLPSSATRSARGSGLDFALPGARFAPDATLRLVFRATLSPTPAGQACSVRVTLGEGAGAVALPPFRLGSGEGERAVSIDLSPYLRGLDFPTPAAEPPGAPVGRLHVAIEGEGGVAVVPGSARLADGSADATLDPERDAASAGLAGPGSGARPAPPEGLVPFPAAWPAESLGSGGWTAYTARGVAIADPEIARDPSYGGFLPQADREDIFAGPSGTDASIYYAYDAAASVLFFRLRFAADPLTPLARSTGAITGANPWASLTTSVLLDLDGDGLREAAVVLAGESGGTAQDLATPGDDVKVYFTNRPGQAVIPEVVSLGAVLVPNDLVWFAEAATAPAAVPIDPDADGATYDFGRTRRVAHTAQDATWGQGWFVDLQVPIQALTASYFGDDVVVRPSSPFALAFATASSPSDLLQKDDASAYANIVSDPAAPFTFSDVATRAGGLGLAPRLTSFAVSGAVCPSRATVRVAVHDEIRVAFDFGPVRDSIQDVLFEHYLDANGNGLEDDGGAWTAAATTGSSLNPDTRGDLAPDGTSAAFNDWGIAWDTSALAFGRYLVRATATDLEGHATAGVVGSFQVAPVVCGRRPDPTWASYADPEHLTAGDTIDAAGGELHFLATSLQPFTAYQIGYYDGEGRELSAETRVSDLSGGLEGNLQVGAATPAGTGHAVVYPLAATPPVFYAPVFDPAVNPVQADDAFTLLGNATLPVAPVVDHPLLAGQVTVGGTASAAAGVGVNLYRDGLLAGRTVVRLDGTWLLPGLAPLVDGESLTATLVRAGLEGPPSAPVVVAADAPDVTATPFLDSPLLAGNTDAIGTCAAPDGTLVLVSVNGRFLATAVVAGGAWVLPAVTLDEDDSVSASATAPGLGTSAESYAIVVAGGIDDVTATPSFDLPVLAGAATVTGTTPAGDGSRVDVFVDGTQVGSSTVVLGRWSVASLPALSGGEELVALGLETDHGTSAPGTATVTGAAPFVNSAIAVGATSVSGTSSLPAGTGITLYVDGSVAGATTVLPDTTWTVAGLTPLVSLQSVTARAVVGSVEGLESQPVFVATAPNSRTPTVTSAFETRTFVSGSISGMVPAGAAIELFINGAFAGQAAAPGGGTWSVTGLAPLVAGDLVVARSHESGRGTSNTSAPFTVQLLPPFVDSPLLEGATTVTGTSKHPDGTVVTVTNENVLVMPSVTTTLGTTVVAGGTWSLGGVTPLVALHRVRAFDTVGAVAGPNAVFVSVSTDALGASPQTGTPTITGPLVDGAVTVTGTCDSGGMGTTVSVFVNDVIGATPSCSGGGTYTATLGGPLEAGDSVTATGKRPNRGTSAVTAPVVVARPGPIVNAPLFEGETQVSGTARAPEGSLVTVLVNGSPAGTAPVRFDGSFLAQVAPLAAGDSVTAEVTVAAMTAGPGPEVVVGGSGLIVTVAPRITTAVNAGATTVNGTSVSPDGTPVVLLVDGGGAGIGTVTAGAWQVAGLTPLVAGQVLTAYATESGSATSPLSNPVVVSVPGMASGIPALLGPIVEGDLAISGTSGGADGTVIEVFLGAESAGLATVTGGAWTLTVTLPLPGGRVVTAIATEPGLGTSVPSLPIGVSPLPPVVGSPLLTGDTTVSGTSTQPPGSEVLVFVDGGLVPGPSAIVQPDGSWSLSGLAPLGAGSLVSAVSRVNAILGSPSPAVWVSDSADTTVPPAIDSPLLAGGTSVGGTSATPDGSIILVYRDGVDQGQTTVSGGGWTLSGLTLSAGEVLVATATASGRGTSAPSVPVVVSADLTAVTATPVLDQPLFHHSFFVSGAVAASDGSQVEVVVTGIPVGSAAVTGGRFEVVLARQLLAADVVTATAHESGLGTSSPSAPVQVVPRPPVLDTPVLDGAAAVSGLGIPGASVTVLVNGALAGSPAVVDPGGVWTVAGIGPLVAGDVVTAFANLNFVDGPESDPVTVAVSGSVSAQPAITAPLLDGDSLVTGTAVDGSTVELHRDGIPVGTAVAAGGSWSLAVSPALGLGQLLAARATEPGKGTSALSPPEVVLPLPPTLTVPIDAGASSVHGISVYPDGSLVEVLVNGILVGSVPLAAGEFLVPVSIAAGDVVTARITVGLQGPLSMPVVAQDPIAQTASPSVSGPLVAGDAVVSGTSFTPDGTAIDVFANGLWLGRTTVVGRTWTLPARRPLVAFDRIFATATAPGFGTSPASPGILVAPDAAHAAPAPVVDAPIYSGQTVVTGSSTFPDGAAIDVYVDGARRAQATVAAHLWSAGVPTLTAGQAVFASQVFTGYGTSAPSSVVVVLPRAPLVDSPILAGATGVTGTALAEAPGTTVNVYVNGGLAGSTTVQPGGAFALPGIGPLAGGDVVTAAVEILGFEGLLSPPVVVSALGQTTPAPSIDAPLFDRAIGVTGTSPSPDGTEVRLYIDGSLADSTTVVHGRFGFPALGPLVAGQQLTATARENGKGTSPPSPGIRVVPLAPVVSSPLPPGFAFVFGTTLYPDGTEIDVFVNGVFQVTALASGGGFFAILPGPSLAPGDRVTARTRIASVLSPPSAEVIVISGGITAPPLLTAPLSRSTEVSGIVTAADGSRVDLSIDGVPAGQAIVAGGVFALTGLAPLRVGQVVSAVATEPGLGTSPTATVTVLPRPPLVDSPIVAGSVVVVTGRSDEPAGSSITVYRNGSPLASTATVGGDGSWQHAPTLLVAGDLVSASVEVSGLSSSLSNAVTVAASAQDVTPPPTVTAPIHGGDTVVRGTVTPAVDTLVLVYVDGVAAGSVIPNLDVWQLITPPLRVGQVVIATATHVGLGTSAFSNEVVVGPRAPVVNSPIAPGATSVSGTSAEPGGTLLLLFVDGVPAGQTVVGGGGTWTVSGLAPLGAGRIVTARTSTSGVQSEPSAPVVVGSNTTASPVLDAPVLSGATTIAGSAAVSDGAPVDVFVDGVGVGRVAARGGRFVLTGLGPLRTGQRLRAVATEPGSATSAPSAEVVVGPSAPQITVPLLAGDTAVNGTSAAQAGATVEVEVNGISAGTTQTDAAGAWSLGGLTALAAGEAVRARLTELSQVSAWSATVIVSAVGMVTADPVVDGALSHQSRVSGTAPGSPDGTQVDVFRDGVFAGTTFVSGGVWVLGGIAPLRAGEVLTAVARAPGLGSSAPSAPVVVQPRPPFLHSPVFEGERVVRGWSGEGAGSQVTVRRNGIGVGFATVGGDGSFELSFFGGALVAFDSLDADVTAGGVTSLPSIPVVVGFDPAIVVAAPVLDAPIPAGAPVVTGVSVAPAGSLVAVYVNGSFAGFGPVSGAGTWIVALDEAVAAGDQLVAVVTPPASATSALSTPVVVGLPALLRNDAFTTLNPLTPAKTLVFAGRFGGDPALDPLGPTRPLGFEGEGALAAENGSSDGDDLYVLQAAGGMVDPDGSVLGDSGRPLVVYGLLDGGVNRLFLVKTGSGGVKIDYAP